jgi:hypothetical protein
MQFKQWLNENEQRSTSKLGLYPDLMDAMGQYPPLYNTPIAADFITYFDMMYGKKGMKGKKGIIPVKKGKAGKF